MLKLTILFWSFFFTQFIACRIGILRLANSCCCWRLWSLEKLRFEAAKSINRSFEVDFGRIFSEGETNRNSLLFLFGFIQFRVDKPIKFDKVPYYLFVFMCFNGHFQWKQNETSGFSRPLFLSPNESLKIDELNSHLNCYGYQFQWPRAQYVFFCFPFYY